MIYEKEIDSSLRSLDGLILKADALKSDPLLQGELTRYACVMASGVLELAIRLILMSHLEGAKQSIRKYMRKSIDRLTNLNCAKIVAELSKFDADWGLQLESAITVDMKLSVNALLGQRHLIAHGKSSSIVLSDLKVYVADLKLLIAAVKRIVARG